MRITAAILVTVGLAHAATATDLVFRAAEFDNGGPTLDPFLDIAEFSTDTTLFRIGNNPTAVAYDGANLYIAGIRNDGGSPDPALVMQVAELSDFFNGAAAKQVLNTSFPKDDLLDGRGFTGMDWNDRFGLLATLDRDTTNPTAGTQVLLINRTNPGDFSATLQLAIDGVRGISGPAYDFGWDGLGFMLADGSMGPAAATPIAAQGRAFGFDPTSFLPADDIYGFDFGNPTGPGVPLYTFFTPDTGTLWRDFDIHPDNGNIVARGLNAVLYADRNGNTPPNPNPNGTTNIRSFIPPNGAGNAIVQTIEIVHNPTSGPEFVAINDRPTADIASALPFQQTVRFFDFDQNELSYEIRLPDGSLAPLDTGGPANIFSFFWYEPDQILFVVDGNNRDIYALTLVAPCDVDLDGNLVADFFDAAVFQNNPTDYNNSGGAPDQADYEAFVIDLTAGCP